MALPIGRRLALLLRRSWTASWRARRQQHQQQREAASRPWPAARARVRACAAGPRAPPLSTSSVGRMASREFNPPLPATDWKVAKKHLEEIDQTERRCYYKSERFVVLDEVPTWKDFSAQEELKQPATHYKKDDILNEKVSLLQEDLTKLEIDAIVNADAAWPAECFEHLLCLLFDDKFSKMFEVTFIVKAHICHHLLP
ncbi:ADP-ribose glycohydrolase MACROD1-like isoform X3 [Hemitrygon akajei]|uniref:ADP-ribose glycohydrolase MACROD1-like isoform X3 n=1 Tax=Hemitrygon akajei TaxID=2704970 RepID=UPI003BF9BA12